MAFSGRKLASAFLVCGLMAGEWTLMVGSTRGQEMLVGAASLLASFLFLGLVQSKSKVDVDFQLADVALAWRIPWNVLKDSWLIVVVLLRDLFTSQRAASLYRVSGFVTAKDDPCLVARRVLATLYTTMSPNSMVIDIDYAQSRMLFHQLRRSELPKLTKLLGARP